jgi:hypothetical protein
MKDYSEFDRRGKESNNIDHIKLLFNDENYSIIDNNKDNKLNETNNLSKSYSFSKNNGYLKLEIPKPIYNYSSYFKEYKFKIINRNNKYIEQLTKGKAKPKLKIYLPPLPQKNKNNIKIKNIKSLPISLPNNYNYYEEIKKDNDEYVKKKWNYSYSPLPIREKIYYLGKSNLPFNPIISPKSSYFFDMRKMQK